MPPVPTSPETPDLARRISLPMLTLYGLGVTIGAGIYVIIGAAAGIAGEYTPLAFLAASCIAGLSALSFAELSTRFPVSAGEAAYIEAGLGWRNLSRFAGLAIATSGAVSSATLLQGGVGYILELVTAPPWLMFAILLGLVASLVAWGISQSLMVAAVFTVLEILGLVSIIVFAPADPFSLAGELYVSAPPFELSTVTGLSAAVMLAFFAFIGFEDMVNVVEEVRDPGSTLPTAIILTLVITTVLYIWISIIALSVVPRQELAESNAPLALILSRTAGYGSEILSLVAIVAVLNGAIIQLIMVSRVLYGMSRLGQIPAFIGAVSPITRTPLVATAIVTLVVAILGLLLELEALAATTSSLTLAAFALVNLSLWRIKHKDPTPHEGFTVPAVVPLVGFLSAAGLLVFETIRKIVS